MRSDSHSVSRLDRISTDWAIIRDPPQFVLRYAPAIYSYLAALTKSGHEAEEVAQDFYLRVLRYGFARASRERGRFRDYLKAAVRNAARDHWQRRRTPHQRLTDSLSLPTPQPGFDSDQQWLIYWRRCLLKRVWRALERHQKHAPGNLFHTVLRMVVEHQGEDSEKLAGRVGELTGRPIQPATFRKQVSRARRMFAQLLLREVEQTLDGPSPGELEEELTEIGLMRHVRDFLPTDWRKRVDRPA
jgi:DNA-directed RNA polymerase specialized sigma24 family protein